jgi:hypothetical protein
MKALGIRFLWKAFLAVALVAVPPMLSAQFLIGISVNIGPPALPVYIQPPCPQPNYMWTPGYWAWDGISDYYRGRQGRAWGKAVCRPDCGAEDGSADKSCGACEGFTASRSSAVTGAAGTESAC